MSCYEILGINSKATDDEIKKIYKKLILIHHPDKCVYKTEDEKNNHALRFVKINEAYDILKDVFKRQIYDKDGISGLKKYIQTKEQEENIKRAKESNDKNREERKKRLEEKKNKEKIEKERIEKERIEKERIEKERIEKERIKKELEEQKLQEQKRLEKIEFEKKKKMEEQRAIRLLKRKKEAEDREKEIVLKRQIEIELEIKINKENEEKIKRQEKIKNKIDFLKKNNVIINPLKKLILEIDCDEIVDIESYIMTYIINKTLDVIINDLDDNKIKQFYLKLKNIKDYYDIDYNNEYTKKNIRGKLMLKNFINLCSEYSVDKYVIEKYEQYLIKKNCYDSSDFYFLKEIVSIYINLIKAIIPNV